MKLGLSGRSVGLLKIGIIGGTGFDCPDFIQDRSEKQVDTPYGSPSDVLICGKVHGVPCVLLSRHGRSHSISPSNVNYRANMYALWQEGCTHVLASNACGSLVEEIHPGDVVLPDQFIDRTTLRVQTFFDGQPGHPEGVCHIPMGQPFCQDTVAVMRDAARDLGIPCRYGGTVVVIEGPRFSSKAESFMYKTWGGHLVGMTTVPEVVLAKEAGISYSSVCLATDYDCWNEDYASVGHELVVETFMKNSHKMKNIIAKTIEVLKERAYADEAMKRQEC